MTIDIQKFKASHILVVGDLMIDEYLWGDVDRISPEAPVQVVSVTNEQFFLGGAGNVINNLITLGAKVSAVGVCGSGSNGQFVLNKLNELGVNTGGIIQEPGRSTTRKTRIIANHQHVLRIDRETKIEISRRTFNALARAIGKMVADVDVVLISDYGKGLITEALITKMITAAAKYDTKTIVDPKGINFKKYSGVSLITPNKKEAALASGVQIVDDSTLYAAAKHIIEKTAIDRVLITCGKEGMVFFERNAPPYKIDARVREVYDVSGAGDTVVAVLGLGIAAGYTMREALVLANTAAGIVVDKVGTATVSEKELTAALKQVPEVTADKHKTLAELSDIVRKLAKKGKRIVLTNGCFDLLHVGHVMLLSASKKLGDALVVAIDDDKSVRRLKGPGRPVINETERLRIISALDSVDYVIVFSSHELDKIIRTIRPAVLTKGSNYGTEDVHGREIVEQYGGRVELIPITENISTTRIINTIKNK
jgi:D-beta-D-heptose 7-phosphate kinase/D-beta-D-heptose 1-phosphate adenosyltransferase